MSSRESAYGNIDWLTVLIYGLLVILGWLNIFAVTYDENVTQNIFDFSLNSGKQLIWILSAIFLIILIMAVDFRFYEAFGYIIYGLIIFSLLLVLFLGREVAGSNSWFEIGPVRFQPSEFAKFATALAMAKYLGSSTIRMEKIKSQLILLAMMGAPALLIIFQGDTGTAMVFSTFLIVLYREGFSQTFMVLGIFAVVIFVLTLFIDQVYLIVGVIAIAAIIILFIKRSGRTILTIAVGVVIIIGVIVSVDYTINNVLKPHQQNRVKALINPAADPLGYGWNVTQSKIAIGSGGFNGKGFLNGTQTKFDFVPEQSTDFIFCTIGEEHGWLGSLILIGLFMTLLLRTVFLAERQKNRFARVYGYSVVSLLFFHFAVNIGMTIGLFPVIGIPLPFFSYGGSSLWAFTILLFIFLKLDAHRMQVLTR